MRCTDVFGNTDADPCGRDLGGNVSVDPGFCNFDPARELYDVRLRDDSALLTVPGCGGIGARPVGCAATGVRQATWSQVKELFR
jgi:hypothetical protein